MEADVLIIALPYDRKKLLTHIDPVSLQSEIAFIS